VYERLNKNEPKDTKTDFNTGEKQRARTTKGSTRNALYGNKEEGKKVVEKYDVMMQPVRSMFDYELKKAPTSSSLKERIKLNKALTLSPKGELIGIKKRKQSTFGDATLSENLADFMGLRTKAQYSSQSSRLAHKFAKVQMMNQAQLNQLTSGPYSSNMAFNLTYRTLNVPKDFEHAASLYVNNGTIQPHSTKNRSLR